MTRIVSILASPPRNKGQPLYPEDEHNGHDHVIAKIAKHLEDVCQRRANEHTLYRAWSVELVAHFLEKDARDKGNKPSTIQFIGHGSPGLLSLGHHWTGLYKDRPKGYTFNRHLVLDSNPYVHGVLRGRVEAGATVWLVGCAVGDQAAGEARYIARGPTLLFDLAQMWSCTVAAPTEYVTYRDFDERGLFRFRKLHTMKASGLRVFETKRRRPPPRSSLAPPPRFERVMAAPILNSIRPAPLSPPTPAAWANLCHRLPNVFLRKVDDDTFATLALAELRFAATWDGWPGDDKQCVAELIVNGQMLRLWRRAEPAKQVHLLADATALREVRRSTNAFLAPAIDRSIAPPELA